MPKFHFRLDALLQLRKSARDQRRTELADAQRALEALAARHALLTADLKATRRHLAVAPGAVDVGRLREAQRYEAVLRDEIAEVERRQAEQSAVVDCRREALVAADQDVRALEKLRETQSQRWQADEERRAVREMDEVAGQRSRG